MLGGILPFSPRFAGEWGMSLSSPIKKQTHIFLKPKSLIFGKWHRRGSAVGFTGRGSRAQPPGSRGLPRAGCPRGRPWTAASSSPVPAVDCRTAGAEPPPRNAARQRSPLMPPALTWQACEWASAVWAPNSSTNSFDFSSPCHCLKAAL